MTPMDPGEMNIMKFLLAGGIGAIFARTLTAPLERVKISSQIGGINPIKEFLFLFEKEGIVGL